jgi:uncharacterized protein (DUF1800 family)
MDARAALAHLLRRAGLGPTTAELDAASIAGYAATVRSLVAALAGPDPGADRVKPPQLTSFAELYTMSQAKDTASKTALRRTIAAEQAGLEAWWLERMVATTNPLKEKLTLLLHGHFPTAATKVRYPVLLYQQNQLFRTSGSGDFGSLVQAVAADPAMLLWLDAASDLPADPNENFARELMERFTMGIGTYTENDVRAAAYCFTGWRIDRTGSFTINPKLHSTTPQTVLGTPGVTTGQQVVTLATSSAASAKYVPAAFWSHLAYPVTPNDRVVADLAPGYAKDRSVANLLTAIFSHPQFTSPTAVSGLVKQPIEYVVGALRALRVPAANLVAAKVAVPTVLSELGQIPFNPPSVGGWPQNTYWLSSAAALARWSFADALCKAADLSSVADAPRAARVDAVAELLALPTFQHATATALGAASGNPSTLVALALTSPDYVMN